MSDFIKQIVPTIEAIHYRFRQPVLSETFIYLKNSAMINILKKTAHDRNILR